MHLICSPIYVTESVLIVQVRTVTHAVQAWRQETRVAGGACKHASLSLEFSNRVAIPKPLLIVSALMQVRTATHAVQAWRQEARAARAPLRGARVAASRHVRRLMGTLRCPVAVVRLEVRKNSAHIKQFGPDADSLSQGLILEIIQNAAGGRAPPPRATSGASWVSVLPLQTKSCLEV